MKKRLLARKRQQQRDLELVLKLLLGEGEAASEKDVLERATAAATRASLPLLRGDAEFQLEVKASGVLGGEDGLFLSSVTAAHKMLQAGDAVALYPGTVFFAEELQFFGGTRTVFANEEHIISRGDGVVIDGKESTLNMTTSASVLVESSGGDFSGDAISMMLGRILERCRAQRPRRRQRPPKSPWAIAHFANHPPAGVHPNVIAVPIDWTDSADISQSPTHEGLVLNDEDLIPSPHSVAFIASRDIVVGEEIFLDYKISAGTVPEWYSPTTTTEDYF
eukprot:g3934.t1